LSFSLPLLMLSSEKCFIPSYGVAIVCDITFASYRSRSTDKIVCLSLRRCKVFSLSYSTIRFICFSSICFIESLFKSLVFENGRNDLRLTTSSTCDFLRSSSICLRTWLAYLSAFSFSMKWVLFLSCSISSKMQRFFSIR
jgi:hypothetical protein